jgi:hypothetical protein
MSKGEEILAQVARTYGIRLTVSMSEQAQPDTLWLAGVFFVLVL